MRYRSPALIASVAALLLAGASGAYAASCPFPHPARAKAFRASLGQAFVACSDQFVGNEPNATTESGTPSCFPAETFNEIAGAPPHGWLWGPKGQGTVALKVKGDDVALELRLKGIRDLDGPASGTGHLGVLLRVTLVDPVGGGMTMIDFPFGSPLPLTKGQAVLKTTLDTRLGAFVPGWRLPSCSEIEIVNILVSDPNGSWFATPGFFLP